MRMSKQDALTRYLMMLCTTSSPCLEAMQAFCYFGYGVVILGTGGTWLRGELYQGPAGDPVILTIGAVMLSLSFLHGYGLIYSVFSIRTWIARGSVLLWSALLVFYLYSPTHKIGVVMCLAMLIAQAKTYLWLAEVQRRDAVVGHPHDRHNYSLHRRGIGAGAAPYQIHLRTGRHSESQGRKAEAGG